MKTKITTKVLTEAAFMATLAFVLDVFQGGIFRGIFANGGSIGIAMLPILVLTYRRGFVPGLLAAIAVSFLQMLGGTTINPAIADTWYKVFCQIILDYIIAYPMVCACALFTKSYHQATTDKQRILALVFGTSLGGFFKFLSHFLSGIIFWASSCPEGYFGGPVMFSIVYNGMYMLPNIIINAVIICLISIKQPRLLSCEEGENNDEQQIA